MSVERIDAYLLDVLDSCLDRPLPAHIEQLARHLLLDTLGCAIAAAAEPELAEWARLLAAYDAGPLRFPGLDPALGSDGLAQWFAAAACWHEACEGLPSAHGRPGLHALPALLGPALARSASLDEILCALVVGYEVGGRLGAICRIGPGMHVDGTWGCFAAAAAYAGLLGLSPKQTLDALNHAACHMPWSLYRPIATGSTARNAYAGHGARHGVASVHAALAGLSGPPGSVAAMTELALGRSSPELAAPPGTWVITDGYLKLYPAVKHAHYGAAAAEACHAECPFGPDAIDRVTLDIYGEAITYCGNRGPATAIAAQFSLSYCLAWSLTHGRLTPAAFRAASLADPLVRRLEAIVAIREDPALTRAGRRGAALTVGAGTTSWRREIHSLKGDAADRLTRGDLVGKFLDFATPVIGKPRCQGIIDLVLDGAPDSTFALG